MSQPHRDHPAAGIVALKLIGTTLLLGVLAYSLLSFAHAPNQETHSAKPAANKPPPPQYPEVLPADVRLAVGTSQQLVMRADFSNGTNKDVTRLASYESDDDTIARAWPGGRVQGRKPGATIVRIRFRDQLSCVRVTVAFPPPAKKKTDKKPPEPPPAFEPVNFIDELAEAEWKQVGLRPTAPVDDWRFARRAHLHLLGRLPTPREVRRFIGSLAKDKRPKLVDRLLARPEYADHWSNVWGEWLFYPAEKKHKQELIAAGRWLHAAAAENRQLDRLVRELLTATDEPRENGAAAFLAIRQPIKETVRAVSRRLLGASLDCARCHKHPKQAWTPRDWKVLAACFDPKAEAPPGIFGREFPSAGSDPRTQLSDWLTGEGKLLLARNLVNRYWRHLFGRGLMEPGDADPRGSREATLPAVVEALARDLVQHRFDAKHLLRTLCRSRLYQLESGPQHPAGDDSGFHARHQLRRIATPALAAIMQQVTGSRLVVTDTLADDDPELPWFARHASPFLTTTSRPRQSSACEAPVVEPNIVQSLHLVHSNGIAKALKDPRGRIARLMASDGSEERVLEELFLVTLSRPWKTDEQQAVRQHLAQQRKGTPPARARRIGFEDVLWALMNSKEFLFVH